MSDERLFIHHCLHCERKWDSPAKAEECPKCKQWNIAISSRLKTEAELAKDAVKGGE